MNFNLQIRSTLLCLILLSGCTTGQPTSVPSQEGTQKNPFLLEENPFRNAKVGDLAHYITIDDEGLSPAVPDIQQGVAAKDDKTATIKTFIYFGSRGYPQPDITIDLTKPFDLLADGILPVGQIVVSKDSNKVKFEKESEGKERITIGDRTYECIWAKGKTTKVVETTKEECEVKVWFSREAPLAGFVRMEVKIINPRPGPVVTGNGEIIVVEPTKQFAVQLYRKQPE